MRIGINTRLFVKGKMDGIAWYSYEITRRLVLEHPHDEFVFFFDRKPDDYFIFGPNVKPVIVRPQARHPFLWILFFEIGLKRALKKEKIDVLFSPDGWLCIHTPVKTINVIHDINFEHFPSMSPPIYRAYYKYFFPKFARRADVLATVSNFSRQDIICHYNVDHKKVIVTPNAAAEDFFEITPEEKEQIRQQYSNGYPYFIFVGTANKRKNVKNILLSFELFRSKGFMAKLVFAGMKKYWDSEMSQTLQDMKFRQDVIFTGYVSTTDMNRLISSSIALLYPSLFEGFGVPILEAYACSTPVITSNCSAMPEVAGDGAIKVNPININEICKAMIKIVQHDDIRNILIIKGKEQIKKFSWDKSAHTIWQQIEKLYQQL